MERVVDTKNRWFVIINPVAGNGRGLLDFPKISKLLRADGLPHDSAFTEHRYHATELTVEAVNKGYRRIIVVGGDGTLNEVVNGLFIQQVAEPKDVLLAVIAVGTGNDWVRTFGISPCYSAAIRSISEGNDFLQDVARVTYTEARYQQTRYMANVAGLGFEAFVISKYNHYKMKGRHGRWLYLKSIIKSYFKYKSSGTRIIVDDKVIYNNLMFSLAVGVCKYIGGGLQLLPKAVVDDGLLDITLIKPLHWWHIVFRLNKLSNGDIYSIGHVLHAQGKHVKVVSAPNVMLETDGELQGETPVEIEVVHRAIRVVVSREFLESRG